MTDATSRAYVLRINPGGADRVPDALEADELMIGWSNAEGLTDDVLTSVAFRQIVHEMYYATDSHYRRSGAAAGHLLRFIREMSPGDLVVVPHGEHFYVARVEGPARRDPAHVANDTAHRRPVTWLNDARPIPRRSARAALQARLKTRGSSADATDLLGELHEALDGAVEGRTPRFEQDLRARLVEHTLDEMRSGRMNERDFERLVASVFTGLGAKDVRIVGRRVDEGADIVAALLVGGVFRFTLAVQVKFFQPEPPVGRHVVYQLVAGMDAENTDFGIVVTSGTFSEAAVEAADALHEEGRRIELVDGEQLAALVVDYGLASTLDIQE